MAWLSAPVLWVSTALLLLALGALLSAADLHVAPLRLRFSHPDVDRVRINGHYDSSRHLAPPRFGGRRSESCDGVGRA